MAVRRNFVTSTAAKSVIRIYSCQDQILAGSVTNDYYGKTMYFQDVLQMAAILESLFDSLAFPQTSMGYRSFKATSKRRSLQQNNFMKVGGIMQTSETHELEPAKQKEKASFVVHVQFRQNATWQGTITWIDRGVTQHFRSVLEMIRLMTEAVESSGENFEISWGQDEIQ